MRTSESHPLRVAVVAVDGVPGRVGVTLCPGKYQPDALTGAWDRDLERDLDVIAGLGATTVVTLVEPHELQALRVPDLGARVEARGMTWWHLPIRDQSVPDEATERRYREVVGPDLRRRLAGGELVVVHCKGGLGRAGLMAARLLIEHGASPTDAIARVRAARDPRAIETRAQERFLKAIPPQRPLAFTRHPVDAMRARAAALRDELTTRRSVRHFSTEPIPLEVVRDAIATAASAPSGANKQPWTFVLVTDPAMKRRLREAVEAEERRFYDDRAPERWLRDLEPLGTAWEKPYLEDAPALIVVFAQATAPDGARHYYVKESVGIASGFLLAALHHAGLATLTHTPAPMAVLAEVLDRPSHEKPYLLIPVGYPADGCLVPAISRKDLDAVLVEVPPS